ncbi:MAG: membrane-bound transcriptional regulator LytR [Spirochaetes bacterium ADurb.Bin269]|nr:MAG: membrane-bound transcriptional regulator LytR [Spirochaetes bacterium ADurb.Bin269]HPX46956.1 LCP family protein [Treponemataceae bacterium]
MKSIRLDRSILFLLIIFTVLLVTGAVLIFSMKTDPLQESLSQDSLLKVLVVIEHEKMPVSSHILAYYPGSNRAAMFDIPGETGLILKSLGRVDRIDAVFAEKGIRNYKTEIEGITGISVPFYLTATLDNFARLTDLVGGLEVFIPTPVDTVSGSERVLLPSGAVTLDGDKVISYMTYTDSLDQEGESAARKQRAVLAFFKKLNDNSSKVFSDRIFPVLSSCLESNVPEKSKKDLLAELSRIDAERLVPQRVTGSLREVDGKELLFPFYDGQLLKDIVRQTLGGLASEVAGAQERIYALEILNGTRKQGLARKTSELYQSFGYDVIAVRNADTAEYEETVLIDRIGNDAVSKSIAQVIRCENIQTASLESFEGEDPASFGTEASVDFTIILGKDFDGRYVR